MVCQICPPDSSTSSLSTPASGCSSPNDSLHSDNGHLPVAHEVTPTFIFTLIRDQYPVQYRRQEVFNLHAVFFCLPIVDLFIKYFIAFLAIFFKQYKPDLFSAYLSFFCKYLFFVLDDVIICKQWSVQIISMLIISLIQAQRLLAHFTSPPNQPAMHNITAGLPAQVSNNTVFGSLPNVFKRLQITQIRMFMNLCVSKTECLG